MSSDGVRVLSVSEALDEIGDLAIRAWFDGDLSCGEVVEEVVHLYDALTDKLEEPDGNCEEHVRVALQEGLREIEEALPPTWCPDLPLAERIKNLAERRKAWLKFHEAQEARIAELEVLTGQMGDPALSVNPMALVRLRQQLLQDPETLVLRGQVIDLLKGMVGLTYGPQVPQPTLACPLCKGTGMVNIDDCPKCDGEGVIPDVEGMSLRLAELECEVKDLRDCVQRGANMMRYMTVTHRQVPKATWQTFEDSLHAYRNNGYEYSDHIDDFDEPTENLTALPDPIP